MLFPASVSHDTGSHDTTFVLFHDISVALVVIELQSDSDVDFVGARVAFPVVVLS